MSAILETSNPPCAGRTRTKDKYRVVYSDHQRLELEKEFHYSRYITIRRKAELAQALNLTERQVGGWGSCVYSVNLNTALKCSPYFCSFCFT